MSNPSRGTKPQRNRQPQEIENASETVEQEPLEKGEINRLHGLGYKNEHIKELSLDAARQAIAKRAPRPGSAAFLKSQEKLYDKIGMPQLATERISDEGVDQRNATRTVGSGVVVSLDEYSQEVLDGRDPIDTKLLELEKKFPENLFRAISPTLPPVPGPQFQTVYDAEGQAVKVGDLIVGFMPKKIYDEAYRKPNLRRSQQMSGQIPKDVKEASDPDNGGHDVPVTGKELGLQQSATNY